MFVKFPFDKSITEKLRKIAACKWSQTEKAWHVEASHAVFAKLKEAFPELQPLEPGAESKLVDKTKPLATSAKAQKLIVKAVQYKTGRFRVIAHYHPLLASLLKSFPFATYSKGDKWWSVAIEEKQHKALEDFCKAEGMELLWEDERQKKRVNPKPRAYEIPNYRTWPDAMLEKLEVMLDILPAQSRYTSNPLKSSSIIITQRRLMTSPNQR